MNQTESLADRAVKALAAVAGMDEGLTNDHDVRHQIRTLKRLAEQQLTEAFHQARELAYLGEQIRNDASKKEQGGTL